MPYFLIDADKLRKNLEVLQGVMHRTGAKILLAQKCFSCYALYPMIKEYLIGATASGIYEARLCHEEMCGGKRHELPGDGIAENHVFAPAFREEDFEEITHICDHIVFNSPRQLKLFGARAKAAGMQVGLRINPECSTQEGHAIYDPCSPGSRLGTTLSDFENHVASVPELYNLLDGLHFHTLCEQNSDDLEITLDAFEEKFGKYLSKMKWVNFGGGHHITRGDYDILRLERCITRMTKGYGLEVYLEPGEAVALNAGTLHTTVLEVQPPSPDGFTNVILDTSAACHMPDVIEMPYTPPMLLPSAEAYDDGVIAPSKHAYRFGGPTCLSGDVIGRYLVDTELHEGDEVIFGDMAIYSMVKTNTFNGMPLPNIYIREGNETKLWKEFGYNHFKERV